MKTGELLADLLEKAGVDTSDEKLKDVLGIGIEIPEEAASEIQSKLLTVAAAKNNTELKNHFVGNFAKGTDQNINEVLSKMGVPKEEIDALMAEKTLGKRLSLAIEKVSELTPKTKGEDKELKAELTKLNNELAALKSTHIPKEELDKFAAQVENERISESISSTFTGMKWSQNYPEQVRADLAKIALEKELQQLGATLVRKDGQLKVVRSDNKEMDYFDSKNKNVTFTELAQKIMSVNKFEAVSAPTDPGVSTTTVAGATQQSAQKNTNPLLQATLETARKAAQAYQE